MIPLNLRRTRKQLKMWGIFNFLEQGRLNGAGVKDVFLMMQHRGMEMGEAQIRRLLMAAWKAGALLRVGYAQYRSVERHAEMGRPPIGGGFRDRNADGSWRPPEKRLGIARRRETGRDGGKDGI